MITKFSNFNSKSKKVDTPPEKYPVDDITKKQPNEPIINKANSADVKLDVKKIDEAVTEKNENFVVQAMFEVPKALIKEYIEKIKSEQGKNPLEFWGARGIAEEAVKYILNQYLKIDNLPASALMGEGETRDDLEQEAESSDIEVTEAAPQEEDDAEEDFTKDTIEEEVPIEEEEMFGMSEGFTDNDIVFKKSKKKLRKKK